MSTRQLQSRTHLIEVDVLTDVEDAVVGQVGLEQLEEGAVAESCDVLGVKCWLRRARSTIGFKQLQRVAAQKGRQGAKQPHQLLKRSASSNTL